MKQSSSLILEGLHWAGKFKENEKIYEPFTMNNNIYHAMPKIMRLSLQCHFYDYEDFCIYYFCGGNFYWLWKFLLWNIHTALQMPFESNIDLCNGQPSNVLVISSFSNKIFFIWKISMHILETIVEVANSLLVSTFLCLFSGLLVQSKVYLESSQKSAMELFCEIS